MLCFVRCFLRQRSVNSVHPSSLSLAQDGAYSQLQWSCDTATFCSHVMWLPFAFLSPFHHSSFFSSFYYFNSDFWYIDMHPTLAGLYPFLLGSPARCTFLSYLCLYIYLGSPARSRLSRSAVALTAGLGHFCILDITWHHVFRLLSGKGWPLGSEGLYLHKYLHNILKFIRIDIVIKPLVKWLWLLLWFHLFEHVQFYFSHDYFPSNMP